MPSGSKPIHTSALVMSLDSFMLPLCMQISTSISSDATITAHILPCFDYVGMDVKQYIHSRGAQSQKFENNKHGDGVGGGRNKVPVKKETKAEAVL